MASKQKNPNIGMVPCWAPGCTELAAVRRGKQLYFDCPSCGRFMPQHAEGQARIKQAATMWERGEPPADAPTWIADQWQLADIRRWPDAARAPRGQCSSSAPASAPPQPERQAQPEPAAGDDDLPAPPPVRQPDNKQSGAESYTPNAAGDDDPDDDPPRSWLDEL